MINHYENYNNSVFYIKYHFVFCTRYRRKLFSDEYINTAFICIIRGICEDVGFKIVSLEVKEDHVYLCLMVVPIYSPADIMAKLKGPSFQKLKVEFPHLQHLSSLWTRAYFVSTEDNISSGTISAFVEQQKTRG